MLCRAVLLPEHAKPGVFPCSEGDARARSEAVGCGGVAFVLARTARTNRATVPSKERHQKHRSGAVSLSISLSLSLSRTLGTPFRRAVALDCGEWRRPFSAPLLFLPCTACTRAPVCALRGSVRLPGAGFAVLGLAVLQFDDCRRFSETHSVSLSGAHKISHQFEGLQPCKSNSVTCQG